MKKLLLILPVAAVALTGCVVYQPSPTAGQYGYTYDYQVPIAEGIPAPTFANIPEPRRTSSYSSYITPVVADLPPPPIAPPNVSSIPELTPRPIIQNRTTLVVPQQPQVIREGAGAEIDAYATNAPAVQPGYPLPYGSVFSGSAVNSTNTNNVPTNNVPTNNVPTNNLPTNNIPTNNVPTNGFQPPPPGTNVNEGAGADIPNRLEPAPRLPAAQQLPAAPQLPAQPTLQPGTDQPAPNSTPNVNPVTPQQQPSGSPVPGPAPQKQPVAPSGTQP